jgi:hypothetical protein
MLVFVLRFLGRDDASAMIGFKYRWAGGGRCATYTS